MLKIIFDPPTQSDQYSDTSLSDHLYNETTLLGPLLV